MLNTHCFINDFETVCNVKGREVGEAWKSGGTQDNLVHITPSRSKFLVAKWSLVVSAGHHNIIWRRKAATAVGMIVKVLNDTFFRSIREKKVDISFAHG